MASRGDVLWETTQEKEVVVLASVRSETGRWERWGAVASISLGWAVALTVLAFGAGLALHASGVFGLPIPDVESTAAGSYLLWRQAVLETLPAWLEPLKFLAPALVLVGIGLTLSRILRTIRLRADATERSLPALLTGPGQR